MPRAAAGWYLMAFLSAGVALYAPFAYTVLPLGANAHPEMGEVFRTHRAGLYTGARAYDAIRKKELAEHRRWMIRNYALADAAVMLRLYLPAAVVAGADFSVAYGIIAWACWVPNVFFAEWLLRATSPPPPASP